MRLFAVILSFCVIVFVSHYVYVLTVQGFFSTPAANSATAAVNSAGDAHTYNFYTSVFQDLIADGYLSPDSKALCIGTSTGQDVAALKEIGVSNTAGISKNPLRHPFKNNTFDFEFAGDSVLDGSPDPAQFASEVSRTLKSGGYFVLHTLPKDRYSLDSLLVLFNSYTLVTNVELTRPDSLPVWEIVLKKEHQIVNHGVLGDNSKCSVPGYKRELIKNSEPLVGEEPLKPWITLKRNVKNIKYLPSMVDISFKQRYIYVDVGARNYGSSIGGWFKKQYPKQNRTFEIYAVEADKVFHEEYKSKKGVTLLPFAAWVRNETLFFEINRDPSRKRGENSQGKGRGMGRIQAARSSGDFLGDLEKIQGFDFAEWLKRMVSGRDFVVMKMDVEGTEFHLITKLVESGAICLIDEMFLECHYNRWQRCCPGVRSPKYQKTYAECLELFTSLRQSGVLVHQWW